MRHLGGFALALLTATGGMAQRSGVTGIGGHSVVVSSGFGSLARPGGTWNPVRPYRNPGSYTSAVPVPVYAYPVYIGGYAGGGYAPYADAYGQDYGPAPDYSTPPPPVQPPQPSMMMYPSPDGGPPIMSMRQGPPPPQMRPPGPPASQQDSDTSPTPGYLIAFKDHSVYSAMAYWVDGDTLHYFTNSNTHNQASLSLVDRDLTERLNREMGVDLKLPPAPAAAAR
jgi:hypothetical protein